MKINPDVFGQDGRELLVILAIGAVWLTAVLILV